MSAGRNWCLPSPIHHPDRRRAHRDAPPRRVAVHRQPCVAGRAARHPPRARSRLRAAVQRYRSPDVVIDVSLRSDRQIPSLGRRRHPPSAATSRWRATGTASRRRRCADLQRRLDTPDPRHARAARPRQRRAINRPPVRRCWSAMSGSARMHCCSAARESAWGRSIGARSLVKAATAARRRRRQHPRGCCAKGRAGAATSAA